MRAERVVMDVLVGQLSCTTYPHPSVTLTQTEDVAQPAGSPALGLRQSPSLAAASGSSVGNHDRRSAPCLTQNKASRSSEPPRMSRQLARPRTARPSTPTPATPSST